MCTEEMKQSDKEAEKGLTGRMMKQQKKLQKQSWDYSNKQIKSLDKIK